MITHTTPEEKLKDLRMGLEEASLLARDGGIHSARNILAEKIQQILMPELNASLAHLKADDQNEFVVHYTTIKSVVDMLRQVIRFNRREWRQTPNTSANQKPSGIVGSSPPTFRMYHVEGFNDPSEGTVVNQFYKRLTDKYQWLVPTEHEAYVCSFATPKKTNSHTQQEQDGDNLMFWLLYGERGMGCSIKIKSSVVTDGVGDIFRVSYWEKNHAPHWPHICKILNTVDDAFTQCHPIGPVCNDIVIPMFNQYRYFIKMSDYKHEEECRLVQACVKNDAHSVKFDKQNLPNIRRYINEGPKLQKIFNLGTVITLGPQVCAPHATKAYIESLLKKAELPWPTVETSKVKYKTP